VKITWSYRHCIKAAFLTCTITHYTGAPNTIYINNNVWCRHLHVSLRIPVDEYHW